jgi:large subunit ribosomal protein L21
MYAVVELKGHQYIVTEGAELIVDNVDVAEWKNLVAENVLALFDEAGNEVKVGTPYISWAHVEFNVWATSKGEKVRILKFKRKTRYARLKGFRPLQTVLTVKKIVA